MKSEPTLCPEDFAPTPGTINVLRAWFAIERQVKIGKNIYPAQMWIMGDRHIDREFIADRYQVIKFTSFWGDELRSGKYQRAKLNWQSAYQYEIKKEWPMACMDYERNHGKRSDSGSNGFKKVNEAYGQLMSGKPAERRYRIPTDEESRENFKRLEEEILNEEIN